MNERRGWQQTGIVVELDEFDNPIPPAKDPDPLTTIVDPAGTWSNATADEDRCPKCGRDALIFESQNIPGANADINMFGTCSYCKARVPAPKRPSDQRELPPVQPRSDFGRRRQGW